MTNRTKLFAKLLCGSTALGLMAQMPASAQNALAPQADDDTASAEDVQAEEGRSGRVRSSDQPTDPGAPVSTGNRAPPSFDCEQDPKLDHP